MIETQATPLTEAEMLELTQYIGSIALEEDYELSLEEVHGFITGIICGPKIMQPAMWLNYLFEGHPVFESDDEQVRIIDYFERLYNETSNAIQNDLPLPAAYFPAHPDNIADGVDYEAIEHWCTGFQAAVTFDDEWEHSEVFFSILLPVIIAMADAEGDMLKDFSSDTNETPLNFKNRMITEINAAVNNMFGFMMTTKVAFTKFDLEPTEDDGAQEEGEEPETEVTLH